MQHFKEMLAGGRNRGDSTWPTCACDTCYRLALDVKTSAKAVVLNKDNTLGLKFWKCTLCNQ